MKTTETIVTTKGIEEAAKKLEGVVEKTPLSRNFNLSEQYECDIYLKREDLQVVRSYKIRGAYNLISSKKDEAQKKGVVCASAGNHAQGVAYSCNMLRIKGTIFMPSTTPKQKVSQVKLFGKDFVEIVLTGDTFDDAYNKAIEFCDKEGKLFIHPFDDPKIIEGQGTIGVEILKDLQEKIDYVFLPVGGGGLSAGVGHYFKEKSPATQLIGAEPEGAPSMKEALKQGKVVTLNEIDKFVDGAAVKKVGELNFEICSKTLDDVVLVPEGKICTTIIKLYNEEAIVVEPAGALSIAALDYYKDKIKGKKVVCIVSGSNNDIDRTEEIKEKSLIYEGFKHYFIIKFPQRAGALREFLDEVLGPDDDITYFEYTKKNSKEAGPALVGLELKSPDDYPGLIERMKAKNINYTHVNENPDLFNFLL